MMMMMMMMMMMIMMMMMAVPQVWDDLLAQTARKWALRCELGHDANRDEPGQYNTV